MKMTEIVHAMNHRGIKPCGSTTSGDTRVRVDNDPEMWAKVTCPGCLATR